MRKHPIHGAYSVLLPLIPLLGGCLSDSDTFVPDEDLRTRFVLEELGTTPYPDNNPFNPDRVALGRLLFFDPILSGEKDVSCGTCHLPEFAFTDGRQFSVGAGGRGHGPDRTAGNSDVTGIPITGTPRNAPTVLNAALAMKNGVSSAEAVMFWDGRAVGLEGQALGPLADRNEMRGDAYPGSDSEAAAVAVDSVVARLRADSEYVSLFDAAFPGEALTGPSLINSSTLARAIAAYERELVSRNSPYDRWLAGDESALSDRQKAGLLLFQTQGKCFLCHRGPMFSSFLFMRLGVPQVGPGKSVIPGDDAGREENTGNPDHRYKFRTPSLRNIELTAPYMHDGVFETLEDVVRFYNDGGTPRHAKLTEEQVEVAVRTPLGLSDEEILAIVDFLTALTDTGTDVDPALLTVPESVPSGLRPVSTR